VIEDILERKYVDKTFHDIGLCICFYDFISIGDPMIYPAEGGVHIAVRFRLVIFRPFIGEILQGKVIETSSSGIKISMEFFKNIFIPNHMIMEPSSFDAASKTWNWEYQTEDGTATLSINHGDEVCSAILRNSLSKKDA
jgi:DNA-directed RNA polymerase subunit E'/Rpb7